MNYEVLGSVGFAQLGADNYYTARKIENHILRKFLEHEQFNIPEMFEAVARIDLKTFPYEYSSYDEVCLYYNDDTINDWEEERQEAFDKLSQTSEEDLDIEDFPCRYNQFWEWFRTLENIDFETEELMYECKRLYAMKNSMEVIHRRERGDEEFNLKLA